MERLSEARHLLANVGELYSIVIFATNKRFVGLHIAFEGTIE